MNSKNNFRIFKVFQFSILMFLCVPAKIFAQKDAKAAYGQAVDRVNCETIRFFHKEAGRSAVADKLDCSDFSGILKSIPANEGKTATLAKEIESFKNKYSSSKPLDGQIDAVIAFATQKVEAKPRKSDIIEYKSKLQEEKTTALSSVSNESTKPQEVKKEEENTATDSKTEDKEPVGGIVTENAPGKASTSDNMISWLALLISVVALILAIAAFSRTRERKLKPAGGKRMDKNRKKAVRQQPASDFDENRMGGSDLEEEENDDEEDAYTAESGEEEVVPFSFPDSENMAMMEQPPIITQSVPVSGSDETSAETLPKSSGQVTPAKADLRPETLTSPEGSYIAETTESEALPQYKYARQPGTSGELKDEELSDSPVRDSIIEIELYEDVPDRAFFSFLPYPETIKKALSDPRTYLSPCCSYSDDPAGKTNIVLDEEGVLKKENGRWHVFRKAAIHFE